LGIAVPKALFLKRDSSFNGMWGNGMWRIVFLIKTFVLLLHFPMSEIRSYKQRLSAIPETHHGCPLLLFFMFLAYNLVYFFKFRDNSFLFRQQKYFWGVLQFIFTLFP
jgi:hypothetical protein